MWNGLTQLLQCPTWFRCAKKPFFTWWSGIFLLTGLRNSLFVLQTLLLCVHSLLVPTYTWAIHPYSADSKKFWVYELIERPLLFHLLYSFSIAHKVRLNFTFIVQIKKMFSVGSRAPPINFECVEFHFFASWSSVFKLMNVSVVVLFCPTKRSLRHVLASARSMEQEAWCSLFFDFAQGTCWFRWPRRWFSWRPLGFCRQQKEFQLTLTGFLKMSESVRAHTLYVF